MPTFRPSCVVNFKLKFDETLTLIDAGPLVTQDAASKLAPAPTTTAARSVPLILQQGEHGASWVMGRVPKSLSFERPGYRQAGSFSLELDFRELPIDPRTIRAASVEIHTGTISDGDFEAGFGGKQGADGMLKSQLQTRIDGKPNQETLRMVGIVDEWEIEQGSAASRVSIRGRDLRGILIDTPISPDGMKDEQLLTTIDWAKDIQQVVTQIISHNPFFHDMQVIVNLDDWPGRKLPSPGVTGVVPRHRTGARGKNEKATPSSNSSSSNLNFWDLVTRTCYLVGAIPYMVGPHLAIRPSATVFDKMRGPLDPEKNPTPFLDGKARTRDAVSGSGLLPGLRVRKIVYGRDTETVRISRKYAGWHKPKVVRCLSVNMDGGEAKMTMGLWPPQKEEKARKTSRTPGKESSKEELINVPVPGVKDANRLVAIARSIYEELGRGELGGSCTTKNLASFGGDNTDPDLLRLEPGDGIEFKIDTRAIRSGTAPLVSSYTDSARRSFGDQVKEIKSRNIDENLARVIVATARGQVAELQSYFRVQNVKFNWDSESGYRVDFDFQNYVTVRAQVDNAPSAVGSLARVSVGKGKPQKGGRSLGNL